MSERFPFPAGYYEQCDGVCGTDCDGWRRVVCSRHATPEAAERAARRLRAQYARSGPYSGGSRSWSSWWEDAHGNVHEEG